MSQRPVSNESELIEFIHSIEEPAPERLHRRTEALIARHQRGGRDTRSLGVRLGAVSALAGVAALVVVLVLGAGTGGSGSFSLQGATALALHPTSAAAPRESKLRRAQLTATVDGIPFPYWSERFGWRSTGSRTDRLDGRTLETVFYRDSRGQRIGYAIVAGTPAPHVDGGRKSRRGGTTYWLSSSGGARVVTWLRDGHLCIVAGRGVSSATLLHLASWDDRGSPA